MRNESVMGKIAGGVQQKGGSVDYAFSFVHTFRAGVCTQEPWLGRPVLAHSGPFSS